MRFDPGFALAKDGTDRQIVLQLLERLRDLDQVRIEPPRMACDISIRCLILSLRRVDNLEKF
jgi:hypothetical protein